MLSQILNNGQLPQLGSAGKNIPEHKMYGFMVQMPEDSEVKENV